MTTWNDLRSNWVNGNRRDVVRKLTDLKKDQLVSVMLQATTDSYVSIPNGTTTSGDLKDCIEILTHYLKYKG